MEEVCLLSFLAGMLLAIILDISVCKHFKRKLQNRVHFYVTCEVNRLDGIILYSLWIGRPRRNSERRWMYSARSQVIAVNGTIPLYNLRLSDFDDMKEGEIREVFLNLED